MVWYAKKNQIGCSHGGGLGGGGVGGGGSWFKFEKNLVKIGLVEA